ncbi:Phospholipase/carboxylesterase [Metschnikowia bicuspidata]|uniref:Acyl-protein thioesterase 1 n=1 Tax=Metschnikowia bicuspidata TaxID=27322 RepID=A0A4P9ZCK6_9ASCO|nr:Phospholipase/carboxylesterase [Metschnikowia bicuspidata]
MSISCVRVPATKTANAAVIFVHGLGDSGDGWSWLPQFVRQTGLVKSHAEVNYIFPNAPILPITANGGMAMAGWFDIYEFGNPRARQDVAGFFKSCEVIKLLVKEQIEKHNISPERIILGGFSQGSALCMAVLSLLDVKIGGLVAISGFCLVAEALLEKCDKTGVNFDTPVFQGHGTADPLVPLDFGKHVRDLYKGLGYKNWDFRTYAGVAHSTNEAELIDVVKFLALILDK